jgi:CelD/BcsL family acetyltransferase involved in cellulose biosynthesis
VSELALVERGDRRWGEFLAGRRDVTPFHAEWWSGFLSACYGFPTVAAVVLEGGAVRAGLPLALVRRTRWVSLPFTDACSPLGDAEALARLLDAARGRTTIEVRGELPGAAGRPVALSHSLALGPDPARVHASFHRSQVQRNIRRAERDGVEIRRATSEEDVARTFYALHVRTRRRLGAPVQRRRFFSLLWRRVLSAGHGEVLLAVHHGRPVAGAVFLRAGRTVFYKYGASDERSWHVRPNHLIFWTAIREACEDGFVRFDFGRTDFDDIGLRDFKRGWGSDESELTYSTLGGDVRGVAGARAAGVARRLIQSSPAVVCRGAGLFYRFAA